MKAAQDLEEDPSRSLVPTKADKMAEPTGSKNKNILILVVSIILLLVVVVTVTVRYSIDDSVDPADPVDPDDSGDPLSWMSVSPKNPFSITITLRSASDTKSGVKGQLQLCSQRQKTECCETDRFVFKAPTVLYLNEHKDCSKFGMDKNLNMSMKVLNEDPVKIRIYRFEMMLQDGKSYQAWFDGSHAQQTWSQPFHLEVLDITNAQTTLMKINIKNIEKNPRNATYFNGTQIEIKLSGDNRTGCFTNPIPWPTKKGTVVLNDLETLGTCFTYSLKEAGDNLLVKYLAPSNTPFTVTKILLSSFEEQTFGWAVRLADQEQKWREAEFDEDY